MLCKHKQIRVHWKQLIKCCEDLRMSPQILDCKHLQIKGRVDKDVSICTEYQEVLTSVLIRMCNFFCIFSQWFIIARDWRTDVGVSRRYSYLSYFYFMYLMCIFEVIFYKLLSHYGQDDAINADICTRGKYVYFDVLATLREFKSLCWFCCVFFPVAKLFLYF